MEMPKKKDNENFTLAPSVDPESRERQIMNKAINLVEKQIEEGTVSATVLVHYLKRSTKREELEQEILQSQRDLILAKTSSITKGQELEKTVDDAMKALRDIKGEE